MVLKSALCRVLEWTCPFPQSKAHRIIKISNNFVLYLWEMITSLKEGSWFSRISENLAFNVTPFNHMSKVPSTFFS